MKPAADRLTIDRYCRSSAKPPHRPRLPREARTSSNGIDAAFAAIRRAARSIRDAAAWGFHSPAASIRGPSWLWSIIGKRHLSQTGSLGVAGSLDHRCAGRLAAMSSCEHHCYHLDAGLLTDYEQHLRRMVHLTDGHYQDQCIVLPTLPLYRSLGEIRGRAPRPRRRAGCTWTRRITFRSIKRAGTSAMRRRWKIGCGGIFVRTCSMASRGRSSPICLAARWTAWPMSCACGECLAEFNARHRPAVATDMASVRRPAAASGDGHVDGQDRLGGGDAAAVHGR